MWYLQAGLVCRLAVWFSVLVNYSDLNDNVVDTCNDLVGEINDDVVDPNSDLVDGINANVVDTYNDLVGEINDDVVDPYNDLVGEINDDVADPYSDLVDGINGDVVDPNSDLVEGLNDDVVDPGFDLLFETNLDEMNDIPVEFEYPVPHWIKGTLIRNGLGRFELGKRKFQHAFDAFGKFSSWKFKGNGTVLFSTRFLQSDFYTSSVKNDDITPYLMFEGVTPDFNEVEKLLCLGRGIDNMNVNVYGIKNEDNDKTEYIAVSDFWKIYTFNASDLTTFGHVTPKVPSKKNSNTGSFAFLNMMSTAHPLPEPEASSHVTFLSSVSLNPFVKSTISVVRMNSVHHRQLIARWSVDQVPYMHSFSVTNHYAILFASPFYVNTLKMIKNAKPFESLDWLPEKGTNVYVVEIKTGKVTTIKTDTMFCMHHVNAFENKDSSIVVDVSSYPSPEFVSDLQIEILMDRTKRNAFDPHALLKRYVIDIVSRKITLQHFEPSIHVPYSVNLDMPVINENFRYRKYCYVFGIVLKHDNISLSSIALVKKNMCGDNSTDASWTLPGHYPVEPWFIPNPEAVHEDDGILLVPVINGFNATSYLAILDAKTLQIVNRAYLPTVLPYSLHGRFFPEIV